MTARLLLFQFAGAAFLVYVAVRTMAGAASGLLEVLRLGGAS